jgi:lipoyl-dependent peroxiredoxin
MPVRKAEAGWEGTLREGNGKVRLGSGAFEGAYSFGTRFEAAPGTNPEELIGAAHAGCFSMALSAALSRNGFSPRRIATTADVTLEKVGEGSRPRVASHRRAAGPTRDSSACTGRKTSTGAPSR